VIISIDGRGIKKPVASVYDMDGMKVLRIDDADNAELWIEVVLESATLENGIYESKGGKHVEKVGPAT
jgi:hypothetical protein